MAKKITRRTFISKSFGTLLATVGLGAGGYFYSHKIEPTMLQINHISFNHLALSENLFGLKIIQFSDTHLGFQYTFAQFEKLVQLINKEKPDMIVFTGDLIDEPSRFTDSVPQTVQLLKQLEAPLGKFAVYGNHDHGGYGTKLYAQIMDDSGFTLLVNEAETISYKGTELSIIGIDDAMLGKPNMTEALHGIPSHHLKILLSHAPDVADEAQKHHVHFQLSGHSHGGQVQIPFLGALVKPPFAEKYSEGTYMIGNEHPLHLYVNRGLGTTRLPFRFLSRPELTIITLSNE